jgi:hypothetical protein
LQRRLPRIRLGQFQEVRAGRFGDSESGGEMTCARVATITLFVVLGTSMVCAADFSDYRGLRFGMDIAAATKAAGTTLSEVTIVHRRPALIQEIAWQPRSPVLADPAKAEPVKEELLCFFDGELFRIVVTFDRYRIEGMTADDIIDSISATYGPATRPIAQVAYHSIYGEAAAVVARWEDNQYSYDLVRTGDRASFAMVLYSKRVDGLAQAAIAEAVRLDANEAPQRELEKQKKREEAEQLVLDKARSVNKPNFHF